MRQIPGYRIVEQLYSGTRTAVYRALPIDSQSPVVLKLLQKDYPTFSELIQFRNQYALGQNLNIAGIVKIYNLEFAQNRYILSMEDFGGISLEEYLSKQSEQLAIHQFLKIAGKLANILQCLHQERIIHKDIKPGNILINPNTQEIKITDFSISSLLPRETQEIQNPNVLEGTLAYISPEQTGRMNRGIDYRSDFYGLGVTFYEMLTGQLPFESDDPLELIHCHLAVQPPNIQELQPEIPTVIAEIVKKLMAKNAEDRYQSAAGLKHDLDKCWQQWQETGEIRDFVLGERDLSDRFLIPEKLYGREIEVKTLLEAFDRVANGTSELMLVAGFSGIGKTVVVNEVHKPIVRQRGYFIKGKFDQFNRNIPFSAFVQAFRDLMGQLLSESDSQLEKWKTKLLSALGDNGQVIIEVIPELEQIIGKQPAALELSGAAAQNRFNLLFPKFIQVFTNPEHPLVMFLDDLQWADSASLNLMKLLIAESQAGYLLAIGAYRDNEVSPVHPLMLTLDEVKKAGATVNTMTLAPLSQESLNKLVADTLNCAAELAQPLTELVYQKTKGNPFFATQFLKALHQDGLISFETEVRYWQCDIAKVREAAQTDDVVEFMAQQLQKLSIETQDVLKLAACIGNQFDLNTLAIVYEKSQSETAANLWKALQEGFIIPQSQVYKFYLGQKQENINQKVEQTVNYKFLHDRVQQAAYSLIPETRKQPTHLKIGQQLLKATPLAEREEKLLEIVNQLNQGAEAIASLGDRLELATLNLAAAQKVKSSTAYRAAMEYLTTGIQLLPSDGWQQSYKLTLGLYELAAEVSCLSGDFQQMEHFVDAVFQQARKLLDKVKVYEVKILADVAQSHQLEAIKTALSVLELLGVAFPKEPTQIDIAQSLQETQTMLAGKQLQTLLELPEMVDREAMAAIRILASMTAGVYVAVPALLPLVVFKQVQLSVQYGNAAVSASAYAWYGVILCGVMGAIDEGNHAGELALALLLRFKSNEFKASTYNLLYPFVKPWKYHIQASLKPLVEGYHSGLENGALEYAGYCAWNYCYLSFFSGKELSVLQQEMMAYNQALGQLKQVAHNYVKIFHQSVLNLLGQCEYPWQIQGTVYDEEMILSQQKVDDLYELAVLYISKLILCYLFQKWEYAKDVADSTKQYLAAAPGSFKITVFHFYDSLTQLAVLSDIQGLEREELLQRVQENQAKLQNWAEHAPMNFLHKWQLVEAEKFRVLGQKIEAIELYDKAIALAKENDYIQEEALANELAAKFYLNWGKEKVAAGYMQEAYYCYTRWGAKAKIYDLEQRYPQLLQPILYQQTLSLNPLESFATTSSISVRTSTHSSGGNTVSDAIDFSSVLKAAQAISSTIQLDELLQQLTQIILQNSGANRCVLLFAERNQWQVKAIATPAMTELRSDSLDNNPNVPLKLIQYVKNAREVVAIDNLKTDLPVIDDYLRQCQPKSVLCLPIIDRGDLVGILYLHNEATAGVFTSDRILAINFLCTQAAISLVNARLYQQAQNYAQELEQTQLQIVQSEKMSALGNLVAGVAHEINNPVGFIAGNLTEAEKNLSDLIEHLKLHYSKASVTDIENHAEEIDLDYILEDFPKIIGSMQVGCDRIKNISTSLRTFSRADKDYKVPFNIQDGIDSTLMILKHRLKASDERPEIQIFKEYNNIPSIECFPGQLNQVFMNILANAIDMFDEMAQTRSFAELKANPQEITIKTELLTNSNQLAIYIRDNGLGMPEAVKRRIFDHLFTTKSVGKGTGLGLAIARQIVIEKHSGMLEVSSTLGRGTEFTISIPCGSLAW
ncbi:AAA family ATPase [Microcoleus sp. A003_D6]|uniref:trifunctional serine/threonine-protein kinase/ATP-binding protein/sensor histidine kinase n=1 Tax=Microcoleus sp. A003_D6 TaxID=3055266 RepID=UPI002FD4B8B9